MTIFLNQNIGKGKYRGWSLKPVRETYDITLATDERDFDEEVVFSPLLIGEDDGNRMPFKFNFNSTGTTICQTNSCEFSAQTIVSENYWNPKNINPNDCPITTEICDIGLTGIDNGLVQNISGETIEITTGLYTNIEDKFSRYKYDRRMKLHPITGFTTTENRLLNDDSYNYDSQFNTDNDDVGYYVSLNGGFFQGFYKLAGYDYETFPSRTNLGWTAEFLIRHKITGGTEVGLNNRYPDNKGIFFYMGARAENKFYHYANGSPESDTGYTRVTSGLTCTHTCGCASSASTASTCLSVYQISGGTTTDCSCGCICNCTTTNSYPEKDPLYDAVSNALAIRLSGDTGDPRLCVKTYTITGDCETTGSCQTTGVTYTTGVTVNEWCSSKGIFYLCSGTTYSNSEHWTQIDVVFQRNLWIDDCDLNQYGGVGSIVSEEFTASTANNSLSLVTPPITHEDDYDPKTTEVVTINDTWLSQRKDRLGKLKIFVNGQLFMVIENFEEIIPRLLNVEREKQIGVGYNISLGGGTQGLKDNLTISGDCSTELSGITYQQDPECLTTEDLDDTIYSGLTTNISLEKYFGGSFIGDISSFNMYTEPLNAAQIRHNFKLLKSKYSLLNPQCLECQEDIIITPTPTLTSTLTLTQTPSPTNTPTNTPNVTPTGIISEYFAYIFPEPQDNESLLSLGNYMYDNGASLFFGFGNSGTPNTTNYSNDLSVYASYPGFVLGGGISFKVPVSTLSSSIRQLAGAGVDTFGCEQQQYTFGTVEIKNSDINNNVAYFYSVWIPTEAIPIDWENMKVIITREECTQVICDTIPLPSLSTEIVTVNSGSAIPQGAYRILWMPYGGYLTPEMVINYPIYFKGQNLIF
jgi:hypothetical protein